MINEKNFFSENKKINVSNSASLVNLKAELFKRKQDAIKSKSSNKKTEFEIVNKTKSVSNSKWNQKAIQLDAKIRDSIRSKKAEKSTIKVNKEEERFEKELQRSKENMIRKTKLYEEKMKSAYDSLKNREELKDEDDNELIDFERKIIDASKVGLLDDNLLNGYDKTEDDELDQEEMVEYVDSFGRTRMCKRKELSKIEKINEQVLLRRKLDRDLTKDEDDKLAKSSAYPDLYSNFTKSAETESDDESHYQSVSKDEIREHGTSYYQFSLDKEKRKEQMENLDELRKRTVEQRKKADQLVNKRNRNMKERLLKLAKRKGLVNDSDDDDKIDLDQYIVNVPKKEEDNVEDDIDYSINVKERKLREWDLDKNEFTIDKPTDRPAVDSRDNTTKFFIDKKGECSRSNKLDEESDSSADEELPKFNSEFAPPTNFYDNRKRFKSQLDNEEIEDKVDEFLKFTMNKSRS